MRKILSIPIILFLSSAASAIPNETYLTDDEIREILIETSIAEYSGNCPCPFSRSADGSLCGKRSAWSRPGGVTPYCFKTDIPDGAVEDYRQSYEAQ